MLQKLQRRRQPCSAKRDSANTWRLVLRPNVTVNIGWLAKFQIQMPKSFKPIDKQQIPKRSWEKNLRRKHYNNSPTASQFFPLLCWLGHIWLFPSIVDSLVNSSDIHNVIGTNQTLSKSAFQSMMIQAGHKGYENQLLVDNLWSALDFGKLEEL